jgi:cholesterol oxidase
MLEAVIVGTGFGGAVTACRLAKQWRGNVLVLERGKRWPMGSFPRSPRDVGRNFWYLPDEHKPHPSHVRTVCPHGSSLRGLFDVRNYKHMDVVVAAGLGGGSLIYANVFMEPPARAFDDRWPATAKKHTLAPYYTVVKQVLGARPVPDPYGDGRRGITRTKRFRDAAVATGRKSELVDIMVNFGDPGGEPHEIGLQRRNEHGAWQTSCTYCAECNIGCNVHAKNSLDLNYLHVAEHTYGADVRTEHLVESICPVSADGEDDPQGTGELGYRVTFRDLSGCGRTSVLTRRVIVACGTLGSTELLLRAKHRDRTLPRMSDQLGKRFSGNGDFLAFAVDAPGGEPLEPTYGPVITQRIDWRLFDDQDHDPERAFIIEDASYPTLLAWLAEGVKPRFLWGRALWQTLRSVWSRWASGHSYGSFTYALADMLSGDVSHRTAVMLCMGLDRSNGVMALDRHGELDLDWPYRDSGALYEAILEAAGALGRGLGAKRVVPFPTWLGSSRNNITVHPLGGCALATSSDDGVTNAAAEVFGEVFGYRNLFVADGSLCPSAVGANPAATIAALAERVAEGITAMPVAAKL